VSDHRRDNCESKQQNKTTDATTQYINRVPERQTCRRSYTSMSEPSQMHVYTA